jgi:hypothetical protein
MLYVSSQESREGPRRRRCKRDGSISLPSLAGGRRLTCGRKSVDRCDIEASECMASLLLYKRSCSESRQEKAGCISEPEVVAKKHIKDEEGEDQGGGRSCPFMSTQDEGPPWRQSSKTSLVGGLWSQMLKPEVRRNEARVNCSSRPAIDHVHAILGEIGLTAQGCVRSRGGVFSIWRWSWKL